MKALPNKIIATTYKMSLAELVRLYGIKKYKYVSWYFPVERYKQNSFLNNLTKADSVFKLRKIFILSFFFFLNTSLKKVTLRIKIYEQTLSFFLKTFYKKETDRSSRTWMINEIYQLIQIFSSIYITYSIYLLLQRLSLEIPSKFLRVRGVKPRARRFVETIHYKYFLIIKRE